jgi:hypothetical protein
MQPVLLTLQNWNESPLQFKIFGKSSNLDAVLSMCD